MSHNSSLNLNEQLIEEVKKHAFLYNKKDRDYKNAVKKTRTWECISIKLNLTGAEDCSKKWKSLRDRYTRELKKLNDLAGTGNESQQLEIMKWDLFDSMSFLKNHCEPNKKTVTNYCKQTLTNQSSCESTSEQVNDVEEDVIQLEPRPSSSSSSSYNSIGVSEVTPSRRAQKRKGLEEVNAQFIEAASSFKEMCSGLRRSKIQPTEDELFGQRVVAFIGTINDEQNKDNIKASILKYLADCVSAQFE